MLFYSAFRRVLVPVIFLLVCNRSAAQQCDCPEAQMEKIEAMRDNFDSAGIYQLIGVLNKSGNENCQAYARTADILFVIVQRKVDSALGMIRDQESFINRLACKESLYPQLWLNYAKCYRLKNDYENLSLYAFRALAAAEKVKDKKNELKAIQQVVHLFTRQEQEDKIPSYLARAEKIIAGISEDYSTAFNYNWLAMEYETWYTRTQRKTLLDTALLYADKAIVNGKAFANYEQLTQSFRVYEAVAYHRGELRKAVSAMDSALFYARKIKIHANLASLYIAKALDHLDLGEKAEAIRWADTSIWYVEKDFHGTISSLGVYQEATNIFEAAGNPAKGLAAFRVYEHIKDSLFKVQRSEKINELEQQYNKAKNEKTIRELAQQKRIYLLLALAGLFALIGLVFFIRQQTLKNKQKILETEQRLNRARMNPHFFFNALSSLQSFALQGNDGKSIASNLSKFSHIMRETLESTYKEYVTVEQETEFLNEYLELQKVRFPQKFTCLISSAGEMESDELLIPSMILQPFVENSIEHGFTGIEYPGHIEVSFAKSGNDLLVQITDNGKGLATSPKEESEHISRASQIIRDRIYLLNIKLKTRAGFSIDNNPGGKGVIVKITLPLLYKKDIKNNN